jgi:pimeloyl-ACP methyl ester carboxylesterase
VPFHAIGHSLGGVLLLRLFEHHAELPLARCVLLGAPACGSAAARSLAQRPFGRRVMGQLATAELTGEQRARWCAGAELGIVAGTLSVGLGRLVVDLPVPNDGAVAVAETAVDGASDRVALRVSHTGMLVSATVAREIVVFLRSGRFGHSSHAD